MSSTQGSLTVANDGRHAGPSLPGLLCAECTAELDLAGAAVSLMNDDGQQAVVGASTSVAAELEELQFELGEGPGVDAFRMERPLFFSCLAEGAVARWPAFGRAALDAGIGAIFALPLHVGAIRLGSLGLYRVPPGQLDGKETSTALAYADAAVVVLIHLQG